MTTTGRYVIQVAKADKGGYLISLYDENDVQYISMDGSTCKPEWISVETHGAGVTPFVRYADMLDREGRSAGEVEPFIPAAARVNKTSYDRLVTQHFSSSKVCTVSGMAQPDAEEERTSIGPSEWDLVHTAIKRSSFGWVGGDDTARSPRSTATTSRSGPGSACSG